MIHGSVPCRREALGVAIASLLFFLSLMTAPRITVCADNVAGGGNSYEERAAAEQSTRTLFRRLEVASLVLILVAGGGVILWAVRRR
jgi:hypothetical protein